MLLCKSTHSQFSSVQFIFTYFTAGYFCLGKAKTQYPTDGTTGNICPVGFYCPEGSPAARRCEGGYYTNITGQATCFDCPKGKATNFNLFQKVFDRG